MKSELESAKNDFYSSFDNEEVKDPDQATKENEKE